MAAKWSPEELQFLRNKAGEISAEHISIALGRTVSAVNARAEKLHISLAVERKPWDEEQDANLAAMVAAGYHKSEIGKAMGRTVKAIDGRIYFLRAQGRKGRKP